jgi:hypothetical protein
MSQVCNLGEELITCIIFFSSDHDNKEGKSLKRPLKKRDKLGEAKFIFKI